MEALLKYGNCKVKFKTYLTTKVKQNELLRYAKKTKFNRDYGDELIDRAALIVRSGSKPIALETQTSDGPVELYLTTIGWDDDGYTSGGDESPYKKWAMYEISNYY